jgi:hypothetical protein
MENRQQVVDVLTARVVENAPVRELLRVYSEAVQAAVAQLDDDDLVRSIDQAGYADIIQHFELTVPAPKEEAAAE